MRCDLESVTDEHLDRAEAVVHSAAYVDDWGPRDAWYRGNVIGTRSVLDAARAAGVQRFAHIGTEAAIVRGQHVRHADESAPLAFDSPYPYCATKAEAERLVRDVNGPRPHTSAIWWRPSCWRCRADSPARLTSSWMTASAA